MPRPYHCHSQTSTSWCLAAKRRRMLEIYSAADEPGNKYLLQSTPTQIVIRRANNSASSAAAAEIRPLMNAVRLYISQWPHIILLIAFICMPDGQHRTPDQATDPAARTLCVLEN